MALRPSNSNVDLLALRLVSFDSHELAANQHHASGWGGIRTPGTRKGTAVFKTAAFDHSATHPMKASSRADLSRTVAADRRTCQTELLVSVDLTGSHDDELAQACLDVGCCCCCGH